ncbi:MAG: PD-(D/E)XK nuclease domain-containing protein, partial [Thermoanaerobaculia bacterium]
MRKTVKERFGEALSEALTELREIEAQLAASGNTSSTVAAAGKWKQHTAELIERFGLGEEIPFNEHRQLAEDATTDGLTEALGAYAQMLVHVLQALPESDIKRGYDEEVERPLSAIDDLLGQIEDLYRRATTGQGISAQTAVDGLERWIDRAYKILKHIVGEDQAGQLYSMHNEHGSIEYQIATHVTYLCDLKEEIQKYPEQVLAQEQSTETPSNGEPAPDPLSIVEQILSRFHAAVIQLRHRHADRQTLDVKDEYDVQDLLHVLLRTRFDDIRAEEVSPSYAGGS